MGRDHAARAGPRALQAPDPGERAKSHGALRGLALHGRGEEPHAPDPRGAELPRGACRVEIRTPAAISAAPAMSEVPAASPSVRAERRMPSGGVTRSAIDKVPALKWRPVCTTAQ